MIKFAKAPLATTVATIALAYACGTAAAEVRVAGHVQTGGGPFASSTVTLWAASASEPKQLAQAKSGSDGRFELRTEETPGEDAVLYVVAKGGAPTVKGSSGDSPATTLLTVLGNKPPAEIVINEMTTVSSAFTAAQFIKGDSISGNPLGLRIAAGNAPNLVDPTSGGWGKVLLDPLNSTQTTTLASLNTLGSLITAFATARAISGWCESLFAHGGSLTVANQIRSSLPAGGESDHGKRLFDGLESSCCGLDRGR
jgi:hypothetical protein